MQGDFLNHQFAQVSDNRCLLSKFNHPREFETEEFSGSAALEVTDRSLFIDDIDL